MRGGEPDPTGPAGEGSAAGVRKVYITSAGGRVRAGPDGGCRQAACLLLQQLLLLLQGCCVWLVLQSWAQHLGPSDVKPQHVLQQEELVCWFAPSSYGLAPQGYA